VEMQVRMDSDFDAVAGNIATFSTTFRSGLASALLIEEERVDVVGISRGSVIVDFRILDPPKGQTPARYAHEAADRLENLLISSTIVVFPTSLQAYMKGATVEARSAKWLTIETGSSPDLVPPLAPLVEGAKPPQGCACVAAEDQGVIAGCAYHLGLSPAWCKVHETCPTAMKGTGVQSLWVYCSGGEPTKKPAEEKQAGGGGNAVEPPSLRPPSASLSSPFAATLRPPWLLPAALAAASASLATACK